VWAGEQALVVVSARKIDLLRKRLKADAGKILFADRGDVGTNPTRIIPAWTDFVNEHAGRTLRGCPYDTSALDRDVVLSRKRVGAIPFIRRDGRSRSSDGYLGTDTFDVPFSAPLPEPPTSTVNLVFRAGALRELRSLVAREAREAGLGGMHDGTDACSSSAGLSGNSSRTTVRRRSVWA
jgi:hypothetical protein